MFEARAPGTPNMPDQPNHVSDSDQLAQRLSELMSKYEVNRPIAPSNAAPHNVLSPATARTPPKMAIAENYRHKHVCGEVA